MNARRLPLLFLLPLLLLAACAAPRRKYELVKVIEVDGRQGVATDGERYFVSGSKELFAYDKNGTLLVENRRPFEKLAKRANHIGDISVHDGELFAGIEWFDDGRGTNIQVAVYDAGTLQYKRSIDWNPDSGQVEVSAVAVDAGRGLLWMTDWVNGSHVYAYDLKTGKYAGKVQLRPVPQWQQGIAVYFGDFYITADDGDAEAGESDNLWLVQTTDHPVGGYIRRFGIYRDKDAVRGKANYVLHEREFKDFRRAGEIEGLDFYPRTGELVVLNNRGKRIVRGMPKGLYPGYDREIHELYIYRIR